MLPKESSPLKNHPASWQEAYESALRETDTFALFKCVEVAQAAALTRRSDLQQSSGDVVERRQIEEALENLRVLKRERLRFDDGPEPDATREGSERQSASRSETHET